jgi:PAS domain S-box-containing protein
VLDGNLVYLLVVAAVACAAWYGGTTAGVLATTTGAAGVLWLFVAPRVPDLWSHPPVWVAFAVFLASSLAVVAFAANVRRELQQMAAKLVEAQQQAARFQLSETQLRAALRNLDDLYRHTLAERDRALGELSASQERLRIAGESARFCVFDWSHPDGSITVTGDTAALFGVPPRDWRGYKSLLQCVVLEDRERIDAAVTSAVRSRGLIDLETRVTAGDGTLRWIAIKGTTAYDPDHQPTRTVGIFQDITHKKATEDALVRNEKLATAGRLAAAIAHEINNPLAAATNLLFIIKNDSSLSLAGQQYASMAEQELARLGRIARQTLGFYRENAQPTLCDISVLLDDVLEVYARNMPAGIQVERQYRRGLSAEIVEGEMRQVFSNILMNALQAVGSSGKVRVAVEAVRKPKVPGMVISVEDNGRGIAAEDLGRIFEPFFNTRRGSGTGLGLWIAKQIVERHHGTIHVESATEGDARGTRVRVALPAVAQPAPELAPPPDESRSRLAL